MPRPTRRIYAWWTFGYNPRINFSCSFKSEVFWRIRAFSRRINIRVDFDNLLVFVLYLLRIKWGTYLLLHPAGNFRKQTNMTNSHAACSSKDTSFYVRRWVWYAEALIPWCVAIAATVRTPCFVGSAAWGTTLRLIGKAFSLKELLFPSSEGEVSPTIGTLDWLVLKTHWMTSSLTNFS